MILAKRKSETRWVASLANATKNSLASFTHSITYIVKHMKWKVQSWSYCEPGRRQGTPWGWPRTPPCRWRSWCLWVRPEWSAGCNCHRCWCAGHSRLWHEWLPFQRRLVWSTDRQGCRHPFPKRMQTQVRGRTLKTKTTELLGSVTTYCWSSSTWNTRFLSLMAHC